VTTFIIEVEGHVIDHDSDLIKAIPEVIVNRFRGTVIHIEKVSVVTEVTKKEKVTA
jgi:hypothetical protein